MADVFLSYAREDLPFVRQLTAALQARNRDVWVDLDGIPFSARWMEEIRTAIIGADAVVFVITPEWAVSKICRTELDYATEQSKRLVPIIVRETPSEDVPPALRELNWLPFLNRNVFETDVDRLVETLNTNIELVHLHTKLLTQAREWETRGRDHSLLLRGSALKEAEAWLADQTGHKPAATRAQAKLIHASRRAATRRQRGFGIAGVLVMALMAILTTVALVQRQTAIHQRQVAITRELTTRATALAAEDPDSSIRLAVEAFHQAPAGEQALTSEARSTLLSAQAQDFLGQLVGHTGVVTDVVFSPEGHTVATASDDDTARLWDVVTHRQIATFTGHTRPVFGVAFSPDGHTLATASDDFTARLWDVATHQPIATLAHAGSVNRVAFSPDGRILATVSADKKIKLWDAATHQLIATLTGHTDLVAGVAFSPDGHTLATASSDDTARLWDVPTHQLIATMAHTASSVYTRGVYRVAFSPDGRTLATGSNDGTAQLWDVATHQPIATLTHASSIYGLMFSPDGHTLATASGDGTARLWDVASGRQIATLTGHPGAVYGVAYSPDGHTLATAGTGNITQLWDMRGKLLPRPPVTVASLAFSPDGRTLATGSNDGTARLWDVASRTSIATLIGHTSSTDTVAFSPDGRTLATGSADRTVRLWDVDSHRLIATLVGHTDSVLMVAFSPDRWTLASGSNDGTIRLWHVNDPTHPASLGPFVTLTGRSNTVNGVNGVVFSPDGRTLAAAVADGTARLWDVASRRQIATLTGHTRPVAGVAFSPDGQTLATSSFDNTVRLWDVASHTRVATLTGHTSIVLSVAFNPDGRTLATASNDHTVRLWDVASHTWIATLTGHTNNIYGVVFSPNGQILATASADDTVRLWDPDTDRITDRLCHIIGPPSRADWDRLIPDLPYQPTCR